MFEQWNISKKKKKKKGKWENKITDESQQAVNFVLLHDFDAGMIIFVTLLCLWKCHILDIFVRGQLLWNTRQAAQATLKADILCNEQP